MVFLALVIGLAAGALAGWRAAYRRACAVWSGDQQNLIDELHHARAEAARAHAEKERVAQHAESWAAGFTQGRDEVISIVPLLMAQREQAAPPPAADGSGRA
jgi:hypothetical protein